MSSVPAGYVQGISTQQAADRPLSRLDEQFKPVKKLQDMLDTKRILLRDVESIQDRERYLRIRGGWELQVKQLLENIEALDTRYANGPQITERLKKEIEHLETQIRITEHKAQILKAQQAMETLRAAGFDIAALPQFNAGA